MSLHLDWTAEKELYFTAAFLPFPLVVCSIRINYM